MRRSVTSVSPLPASSHWLRTYYFIRFAFSAIWVAAAFTIAKASVPIAALMLIAYPAWDALANFIDARQSGGLAQNKTQSLNLIVSAITTVVAAVALKSGVDVVLEVFGFWAALAGIFQLATAIRRLKTNGAQWTMILSGAQSILAGGFFVKMAHDTIPPTIANFAPYAAFGAFYFLISAIWLTAIEARRHSPKLS